jgi:hypothetical protein
VATALVAALVAVVGILVCRGTLDIPVLAPESDGAWSDADTVSYVTGAALAALLATAAMHLLVLSTPRPARFFAWVASLAPLAAVLALFAVTADRDSQFATALINLPLGAAIGSLVSGSARSAMRRVPAAGDVAAGPGGSPPPRVPPPYQAP